MGGGSRPLRERPATQAKTVQWTVFSESRRWLCLSRLQSPTSWLTLPPRLGGCQKISLKKIAGEGIPLKPPLVILSLVQEFL